MKTIPELIRETCLPDADAMADWLEREHPGLEKKFSNPSCAIASAFKWRETPFGFEKWGKVCRALSLAEASTKGQGQ